MDKKLDLKDVVLKRIKKDFKKTFTELKKDIIKSVKHGISDYFDSKQGYEIFYTSNVNFRNGGTNGGKGFYAVINLPNTFKRYVKISN